MELPFCAIDLASGADTLRLLVTRIDMGTPQSLQLGGVTADFRLVVRVEGIQGDFKCHLTVGNLYGFYLALKACYRTLEGQATLSDHSGKLTAITFTFNHRGHCAIKGYAYTGAYTDNALRFAIDCDQTALSASIAALDQLFDALSRLQGYRAFPY